MNPPFAIACMDVGAPGNIGWAILGPAGMVHGADPSEFVEVLAFHLTRYALALGFECPMYAPLRDAPGALTKRRVGEVGVCWSGGPGGGVLATGIVLSRWILAQLATRVTGLKGTTRWAEFGSRACNLLVWEAFIAGHSDLGEARCIATYPESAGKPHERDALVGALAAQERFCGADPSKSDLAETQGISFAALHLMATGLSDDRTLLNETCVVVKARKPQ